MYGNNPAPPKRTATLTTRKVGSLLRELSDNEDEAALLTVGNATDDPWRVDFDSYLRSKDQLGAMSIIEWWGVCTQINLYRQT